MRRLFMLQITVTLLSLETFFFFGWSVTVQCLFSPFLIDSANVSSYWQWLLVASATSQTLMKQLPNLWDGRKNCANKVLDLGKSLFRGILMLVCLVSFLSIQLLCAFWFSVSCFTFASGVGLNIFVQYFWTFVCCTFIVQILVCLYKSIKPNNSLWLDLKLHYFIDILHKKTLTELLETLTLYCMSRYIFYIVF